MVHAIAADWRSAPLSAADRALCEFATKLTFTQQQMSPADLDLLRSHGFDDRAIHDAVQIIGFFNYITRIADALGVERDGTGQEWGKA